MTEQVHAIAKVSDRAVRIDALKAIAIIAVVLYHMGFLTYGYLGVDIFLVINGYLVTKSMLRAAENGTFSYIRFIYERIIRLWPIVLAAGVVCLFVGYYTMLPDDYENLSETIVASNLFANNILACITTKNYWDVVNDYKPLMHTWYLGVVVQSYFILGLVPVVAQHAGENIRRNCRIAFILMTAVSLALFLVPRFSQAEKFYYLPFRLFELTSGAVIACCSEGLDRYFAIPKRYFHACQAVLYLLLIAALTVPLFAQYSWIRLLLVCAITIALLVFWRDARLESSNVALRALAFVGRYTLGIYIWHQIVLAFFRYTVRTKFTVQDVAFIILLTVVLTVVTIPLTKRYVFTTQQKKRRIPALALLCFAVCVAASGLSFAVYMRAGVVRDVPELEISASDIHRGIHAEYNNRVYSYDHDFESGNSGKIKVLAIGDSFARDWVNILLESPVADSLEISYFYPIDNYSIEELSQRIDAAEYVFYAVAGGV